VNIKAEPIELSPWHNAWWQVDGTADPHWFIEYLDAIRADKIKCAEAEPAQFFDYLDVRAGQHVLEVGCGTGDLLPLLARLVGREGRVVGVDKSEVMIAEARRRASGSDWPIECMVGDANRLDCATGSFDRCFTSAVLQHLPDPAGALAEMVRVVRPGGRVAVTEHDWETQIIAADEHTSMRRLLNFFCDEIRHGQIGRQLPGLFHALGLRDVVVTPITFTSLDYTRTARSLKLPTLIARAEQAGAITRAEGAALLAELERRGATGKFFRAVTAFRVHGHKPYPSFC
jgi:SAM-dependent methyltransferase